MLTPTKCSSSCCSLPWKYKDTKWLARRRSYTSSWGSSIKNIKSNLKIKNTPSISGLIVLIKQRKPRFPTKFSKTLYIISILTTKSILTTNYKESYCSHHGLCVNTLPATQDFCRLLSSVSNLKTHIFSLALSFNKCNIYLCDNARYL